MTYPDDYINKIICGDCLEVMKGMPDGAVDLVVTDIPYNEVNRSDNRLRNLDKGGADSLDPQLAILLPELHRVCGGAFYIFCGTEQVSSIRHYFVVMGLSTRHGYWSKDNPSPMNGESIYLSGSENVIWAKKSKATFNAHCKKAIWNSPVVANQIHPTQKPYTVIADMVSDCSNAGDIILDPFAGSGTTCVAAKQLGRRYIGIEINPDYCKVAEERLSQEELFNPRKRSHQQRSNDAG